MKKKFIHKKDENIKKDVVFCAECGEELDMFGIEGKIDIEKIKARHNRCKEIGKFNGDKCAMLFIAQSNEELFNEDEF